MKKAKILFPALGVLILSSAAAVTGTVAWFTANLKANAKTDTVTVVKTGSELSLSLTNGFGTAVDDFDKDALTPDTVRHSTMVDGSVDLTEDVAPKVYGPTFDTDGKTLTGFAEANGGAYGTQFRATKFTATIAINLEKEQDGTSFGLYIDPTALSHSASEATGAQALRVGFRCGDEYAVWAPYNDTATSLDYVDPTASVSVGEATYAKYTSASKEIVLPADGIVSKHDVNSPLYMGLYTKGGTVSLAVDVYTWFEGAVIDNDSVVLTGGTYEIGFNAVKVSA